MMKTSLIQGAYLLAVACFAVLVPVLEAQDRSKVQEAVVGFDASLQEAREATSDARRRLGVRRTIRDADDLLVSLADSQDRFVVLEFLFRARQRLIALDDDSKHREALLETARELVKAPDELAELRLEADLLLSQAELAKEGADSEARAAALRPFIDRYLETPVGAKVLRLSMVMALELGDNRLVNDIRELIKKNFAGDLEMISFQRDKLGGQVFGAPFCGAFERSDGKVLRFPMDGLGRSTTLLFWSKENGGEEIVKALGSAALENKTELAGRLEIISVNLDELPDAGESIVRSHGLDWQVIRLPGGRENPTYQAYVRSDPSRVTVSPTGQAAMIMSGSTRKRANSDGTPDYGRMFQSMLARSWTNLRYVQQLSSLMAGDFFVLDPMGGIDPKLPPELKATGEVTPLSRAADSIPEDVLAEIQDGFVPAPRRYRLSHEESRASYAKVVDLAREAIAAHPKAPDLWVVRNRLIVGLMGLWKVEADLKHLEAAVTEADAAIEAGYPSGCDVVARLCLARGALHEMGADANAIIEGVVGDLTQGPALSAAALLSLDVADRASFERYREAILSSSDDNAMMWAFKAFLLDRYHRYWMFQVPFTAGWSYGRRLSYFITKGDPEEGQRMVQSELHTVEGEPFMIPEDLDARWTAVFFAKPGPWSRKRDDGLPASPERYMKSIADMASKRPEGDLKYYVAMFSDDAEAIRAGFGGKEFPYPILTVPGGVENPLVHQLGLLSEDVGLNGVLLRKDGRVATVVSGLAVQAGKDGGTTLTNVVEHHDEMRVSEMLKAGKVEEAKALIFGLAPPFDPEAVDDRGRKFKKPRYRLPHLRSRARVYAALQEWDKALADAEEVVTRQLGTDGGMSLRTDELDESEALRDAIKEQMKSDR